MSAKLKLFLVLLLSALIAGATYFYLRSLKETAEVVIAVKQIPAKTTITEEMVSTVEIGKKEKHLIAQNAFEEKQKVVGLTTKVDIEANTIIANNPKVFVFDEELKQKGLPASQKIDDRFFIPEGFRVINVLLDSEGSVGDQIKKSDFVDVIFTSLDQKTGGIYATVLLQAVEVFSVQEDDGGPAGTGDKGQIKTVGLLVSPEQMVTLSLAKRQGKIDLALNPNRNITDRKITYWPDSLYK